MSGFLLVTSGARHFGLPADRVRAIIGIDALLAAPVVRPAVRGVLPLPDGLVSLVHLAAALDDDVPPAEMGAVAVLVEGAGGRVALEVEETAAFVRQAPEPVPLAWQVPWAGGVGRHEGRLVPIVDLDVLVERLRAAGAGAAT
jgi:chemotaxis signal transduction protein